jgi:hypothetical protein
MRKQAATMISMLERKTTLSAILCLTGRLRRLVTIQGKRMAYASLIVENMPAVRTIFGVW